VLETDDEIEIQQPYAIIYHDGENKEIPVECIYDEGKKVFDEEGLKGCIRIFPLYLDARHQQENGALLYVSRKGTEALWTKLFLFNENDPYFRLAYDDSPYHPLAYYNGNILGPLKIWQVIYPENMSVSSELREEYLNETTPRWMNLSKLSILAE